LPGDLRDRLVGLPSCWSASALTSSRVPSWSGCSMAWLSVSAVSNTSRRPSSRPAPRRSGRRRRGPRRPPPAAAAPRRRSGGGVSGSGARRGGPGGRLICDGRRTPDWGERLVALVVQAGQARAYRRRTRAGSLGPLGGVGDADDVEQLHRPRPRLVLIDVLVGEDRLLKLPADRVHRVQAGYGVLEDHGDLLAPDLGLLLVGQLDQVLAAVVDLPRMRAERGSSPMMASEVTLLPEPDSPTMPSTCPGWRSKLTPRRRGRCRRRWGTRRSGRGPVAPAPRWLGWAAGREGWWPSGAHPRLGRVEGVAEAVADEVDDEGDDHDDQPATAGWWPPTGRSR
jgi:hypothetical protein